MGDSKKEKEKKPSFFKGVKSEFSKVSWPGRNDVVGVLITLLDTIIQFGIKFLTM